MSSSKKVGFAHKALLPTEDKKIEAIGFGNKNIPIGMMTYFHIFLEFV